MRSLAAWCVRHRRVTALAWIGVLAVCVAAAAGAGSTFKSNFALPQSDSQRARDLLRARFPAAAGDPATIVVHVARGTVVRPAVRQRVQAALQRIGRLP